jgi:hypothetical protein
MKDSAIIVVGGLYRSRSTWQYNVLRIIAEMVSFDVRAGGADAFKPGFEGVQVIKTHKFIPALAERADYVFTSYRPFYDATLSWQRFRSERERRKMPFREAVIAMSDGLDHFQHWQQRSDYCQQWHDAHTKKGRRRVVQDVCAVLGISVDVERIIREVDAIKPPARGKDDTTLLFACHFTANGPDQQP